MSELGMLMVRAGLLAPGQVQEAHEYAASQSLSVAEAILARGLSDEDAIVTFLQSKLMIPCVRPTILDRVEPATAARIPAQMAYQHQCMPVSQDDFGNLTVAMADPTDRAAVEAVAIHTGAYVIRAVATVSSLRGALTRYYAQPSTPPAEQVAAAVLTGPPTERPAPGWNPPLMDQPNDPTPLSAEAFGRVIPRLVEATDRDQVTRTVLDFLGAGFERVILFVHSRNELRGRDARGKDLMIDAVRQVRIPAQGASVFSKVLETSRPYFGPLREDSEINTAFSQALGGVTGNILVLPVILRQKIPVLVFASGTRHPVDPRSIQELADGVSSALERLIMRAKSSS